MSDTAHDVTAPGAPRLQEVSDGVFAYLQPDGTWWINNTGFLVGGRGVTSVDACSTERRTRAYLETIRSVTPRPVRTLVNTHHHGDHTFGNYLFEGATIVGHEATRECALGWGRPFDAPFWTEVDWGDVELEPPFLTYTEGVTLWVDDLRCEVRAAGIPAHTTNDSFVWIPERRVLFCGDLLFNGGTPFLMQGSVAGAITVLEEVVAPLGAETIVPGHGPVSRPRADRPGPGLSAVRPGHGRGGAGGGADPAGGGARDRPRRVRRADRPRTARRQPVPGPRRAGRRGARRPDRPGPRADRHGGLQRRTPADLPRVAPARYHYSLVTE